MEIAMGFDPETGIYSAALFFVHNGDIQLFTHSYELQPYIAKDQQDAMFPCMVKGEFEKQYPGVDLKDMQKYRDFYSKYNKMGI